jgi:hypothetical protein
MSDQAPTPEERLLCKALRALFFSEPSSDHAAGLRAEVMLDAAALPLPVLRHALSDGPCATCDAVPT